MAQLAHVAGPGVALQPCPGGAAQPLGRASQGCGVVLQKMLRQHQDIVAPCPQRRQGHQDDGEAIVQVGTEAPLPDTGLHIPLGGRDDLDVHGLGRHRPQAAHAFVLNRREHFGLERERQGVDFVEKERAACRGLKQARLAPPRVRKGTGFKAKELCFEQGLRDGGTVDVNIGPLGARATVMHHPCDQPFPRARLALEQHGGRVQMPHAVEGGEVTNLGA